MAHSIANAGEVRPVVNREMITIAVFHPARPCPGFDTTRLLIIATGIPVRNDVFRRNNELPEIMDAVSPRDQSALQPGKNV